MEQFEIVNGASNDASLKNIFISKPKKYSSCIENNPSKNWKVCWCGVTKMSAEGFSTALLGFNKCRRAVVAFFVKTYHFWPGKNPYQHIKFGWHNIKNDVTWTLFIRRSNPYIDFSKTVLYYSTREVYFPRQTSSNQISPKGDDQRFAIPSLFPAFHSKQPVVYRTEH